MKVKHSKLLVVDASVAHSAGETERPVSSYCRDSLVAIRHICHRIVMTDAIQEEWHRHASSFTRKWLASMYARRKVHRCEGVQLDHVDKAYQVLSASEQDGLRKDLCLVEAACANDGVIVTLDEAIQRIWRKCHTQLGLAQPITWINPAVDGVQALEHL